MKPLLWLRQRWTLLIVIVAAVYVTDQMVGCVLEGRLSNWVLFAIAGGWVVIWFSMRLGWWLHHEDEERERIEREYFRKDE